jgi:serine/threonine protein kinase
MNQNQVACDDSALEEALHQDPSSEPSKELLAHVEVCHRCQRRLSEWAGSHDLWRGIKAAMSDKHISGHGRHFPSVALETTAIHWTESMARQLLSPPTHPEMLGRLGRYEIERLIGSGGMGVVFKAFDTELNRPVAIKLLSPYLASSGAARKRFAREARAAAAVVHHHVVPIHNVETDRESPFIVMQYVSGESLQARIDRVGPLELCEILRIGMQVADGLSAAHQQGLVHRDIKPSNILLEEGVDRALISDFGLARAADDASLTRTGFHPGTPQYMSPEQASGQCVDARSDLFSLGSMLYTMCTGRPPFRAENSLCVMRRITESEPTPIRDINPNIPPWMSAVVVKLLSKKVENRIPSAAEARDLLEACLSHVQQPLACKLPKLPWITLSQTYNERIAPHSKKFTKRTIYVLGGFIAGIVGFLLMPVLPVPVQQKSLEPIPQAVLEASTDSDALHFERLCQLRIAYHTRYEEIVKTISDQTSSATAAASFSALLPIKCEISNLEQKLQNITANPRLQSLQTSTDKIVERLNKNIIATVAKILEEPYFNLFGETLIEVSEAPNSMKPFPVTIGHAQRNDDRHFVVWIPSGTLGTIDLSDEVGTLDVFVVNQATGAISPQSKRIKCGSIAELPISTSELGTLCWLKPTMEFNEENPSPDASPSQTWKELFGSELPTGYPTEPIALLQSLNNARGSWIFAGTLRRQNSEIHVEANMEIQGGVKEMLRQDAFPQWLVTITWPRETPAERLVFNILALPEPTGIKWILATQYFAPDGTPVQSNYPMYEGIWNGETATVVWTAKQVQPAAEDSSPTEKPEEPPFIFEMKLEPNGELNIKDYRHALSFQLSGQSAARVGEPYVERAPAIPKLPGGYRIFFASRLEVYLEAPGRAEGAGPRIDKIGCDGKYIFGLIATYQSESTPSDKTGYFWLDSESGEIMKGLELAPWRQALKSKGVLEPRLFGPEEIGE